MPYMGELKQSTQVTKTILMVDSADHITGKTGLTITKYLTKAGGTPTAATMATSELDSTNAKGIYSLVFTTAHTDTLGDFQLHLSATGADPADYWWTVTARTNDDFAYPATSGRSLLVDTNGLVSLSSLQSFNLIGNVSGTVVGDLQGTVNAVKGGTVTVSGTVVSSVVQGGFVNVSGTVVATVANVPIVGTVTGSVGSVVGLTPSLLDVAVSSRMASGTVSVAGLTASYLDVPVSSRLSTGTFLANLPPTAAQIASETLSEAAVTPIASNLKKVNDVGLLGNGSTIPWGPV